VAEPRFHSRNLAWIRARSGRDRLDTFPLTVAEQSQRIDSKRLAPTLIAEQAANRRDVLAQPTLSVGIYELDHASRKSRRAPNGKLFDNDC
jgi:hypothetical protein